MIVWSLIGSVGGIADHRSEMCHYTFEARMRCCYQNTQFEFGHSISFAVVVFGQSIMMVSELRCIHMHDPLH